MLLVLQPKRCLTVNSATRKQKAHEELNGAGKISRVNSQKRAATSKQGNDKKAGINLAWILFNVASQLKYLRYDVEEMKKRRNVQGTIF